MKIRFVIAFTAIISAIGVGLSSNFQTTEIAAKCRIPGFESAYRASTAVFTGEVLTEEKSGDTRVFEFKVEKYWKGKNDERVVIHVYETARYQAFFKKGEKYLIYATRDADGKLHVGRCSRSRDVEDAAEDLQKLGKGKNPR
jgi:hypothetical protein